MRSVTGGLAAVAVLAAFGCYSPTDCEEVLPVSEDATVSYDQIHGEELCRFFGRCAAEELAFYEGGTVEACIAYHACADEPNPTWWVTPECLQSVRELSCDRSIIGAIYSPLCEIGGPAPVAQLGESCGYTVCRSDESLPSVFIRCDEGLFCAYGEDDVGDTCVAYVPENEPCDFRAGNQGGDPGWCAPGTYCDLTAERCLARLGASELCAIQVSPEDPSFEVDPCEVAAPCQAGTCTPSPTSMWPSEGEPCGPRGECKFGLACADEICQRIVCEGGEGDPCDRQSCADGLSCSMSTNRCSTRGMPCDYVGDEGPYCSPSETCDISGYCLAI